MGHRNQKAVGISECAFADDIVLVTGREADLQNNLNMWNETLKKYNMNVNTSKTKVRLC